MYKQLFLALMLVVMGLSATFDTSHAAGSTTRSINRSCSAGAKAGVSSSGSVRVRFYNQNGAVISDRYENFGGGMSKTVYSSSGAASYSYVRIDYPSSTGIISSAGCR